MSEERIQLSATPFDPEGLRKIMAQYGTANQMKAVYDFEQALREFTGAAYALALNSGTAAIHLALKAAGIGPGDEVLVSTFTYVATVNPIIYLGAVPVFIDSDPITWNIDPDLVEEELTRDSKNENKIKAMIVVHAYGMPANMRRLNVIAERFNIAVIEDAAEALGSEVDGAKLGTLGLCGVFSFNNNKIITTYGGGALITNSEEIYRKTLLWASQSRENKPYYEHRQTGFNYRMGPLAAMQGLSGMALVQKKVARRRNIYSKYEELLRDISQIQWLSEPPGSFSNRWLTSVLVPSGDLEHLQQCLGDANVEVRPLWKPMHEQPVFQAFRCLNRGISQDLFKRGLTLPSSDNLSAPEVERIVSSVRRNFGY